MSSEATVKPAYELNEEGEVINTKKGKSVVIGTFDSETGHLEMNSKQLDNYHRAQVIRCITEDTEGIESGNKVKSFGIKGQERDEPSEREPEKPKASGLLGDKTKEVVDWFFKWRPKEAYIRYGVQLDKSGEPLRAHCLRKEKRLAENPTTGLVEQQEFVTEREDGMIATRQTHLTFLKTEVVGAGTGAAEGDDE